MPDVELLMEVWPPEFEAILEHTNDLTPELDMPLESYARMVRYGNNTPPKRVLQHTILVLAPSHGWL